MLHRPGVSGALLSHHPNGMKETWEVHLYHPNHLHNDLLQKLNVSQLIRENDGVRVYQGQEFNKEVGQHYLQTWLCTPTPEIGRAILAKMAAAK